MMKDAIDCLTSDALQCLAYDEIAPSSLAEIERHLTECDRCRELIDSVTHDRQWDEQIRPILQETVIAVTSDTESDHRDGNASLLNLLGPTDNPQMLGRIGSYEVVGIVGQGGMGVVFKAFDAALDRFVAIKMLLPHLAANGAARKRFSREAQAVAAVVDDHVLPIYAVDVWQETPYIVMQYSRGTTLQKRIEQQGALELKEVLRIGLQTARGLAAAHAQGLVHRDVKPANILLDGTVERAVLTDFGLARAADDASITRTGIVSGTPQYMSPEQVRGEPIDTRSDLFSLGSTMYAMCTGRSPFRSDSPFGVMHRLTHDQPTSISELNSDMPAWMVGIVERLMSKSPQERFESAGQVASLLEQCLAHVQQPTGVPLPVQCDAVQRPAKSQPDRKSPHSRPPIVKWIATAFFLVFFGAVVVLEYNKGTVRIESELDDVAVRVMQGKNVVKELTVSRAGKDVRIAAGNYVIEIEGQTDDIMIQGGTILLTRGETKVASIVHVARQDKQQFTPVSHGRFQAVDESNTDQENGEDPASLRMRAFIEESMVDLVRVGNPATIKFDALPTTICTGRVAAVVRVADPPMRNGMPGTPVVAFIHFDTVPNLIKAGMTAQVDIESPAEPDLAKDSGSEKTPKKNTLTLESSDVVLKVESDLGVIVLRGSQVDVDRTAKQLSDVLGHTKSLPSPIVSQATRSQHALIVQVVKDKSDSTAVAEFIAKECENRVDRMAEELRQNPQLSKTIPIPSDSDLQEWLDRHLVIRKIRPDRLEIAAIRFDQDENELDKFTDTAMKTLATSAADQLTTEATDAGLKAQVISQNSIYSPLADEKKKASSAGDIRDVENIDRQQSDFDVGPGDEGKSKFTPQWFKDGKLASVIANEGQSKVEYVLHNMEVKEVHDKKFLVGIGYVKDADKSKSNSLVWIAWDDIVRIVPIN